MASSTNELLSFVTFYHGKVTYSELLTTISGFYDDGEVSDAKELLFTVVNDLQVHGVPRMKLRNKSVNKRRLDCEDSLSLLEFTDKKLLRLPPFCARNLDRIPRFSPSDADTVRMAEPVNELKRKMQSLNAEVSEMKQLLNGKLVGNVQVNGHSDVNQAVETEAAGPSGPSTITYADAFKMKDADGKWFVVTKDSKSKNHNISCAKSLPEEDQIAQRLK